MLKQKNLRLIYRKCTYIFVCSLAAIPLRATAQAIPDGTLPTTVEQLPEIMRINGGEREGNNLFHSFEEFSIPEGMEAIFENATDIENIFTRITGDDISNIDGILSTQGDANFFLINSNGIIFGENAQLNVGGSFLASTAESIEFEDGSKFATNVDEPLLTISLPIGLGLGSNPGAITVNGSGNQIASDTESSPISLGEISSGISPESNQTLAFIGNEVNFNGGVITTNGGQIFLTSVESGSVGIEQTENGFVLLDDDVNAYQDINLDQQSLVSTANNSEAAGTIFLSAKNINLLDGSFILNQNEGNSFGGSINVNASEQLSLSGTSPDGEISSAIRSETLKTGNTKSANINISTQLLKLRDQGQIQAGSFSDAVDGLGGDIIINVSDLTDLNTGIISASAFSQGNAGNIDLSTSRLKVANIASITSSTVGTGNGGNIKISSDFIELVGSRSDARPTISASSLGSGNAGSLTISTKQLRVEEGAAISSSSFGNGNAGKISVDASESITLNGENSKFQSNDQPQGSTIRTSVQTVGPVGQKIFGLPAIPTGNAGNVTVKTPSLKISAQGNISVENQGTGNAGTLSIDVKDINLDSSGSITAAAASGEGGNIEINTTNLIAKKNSQIITNARGQGNGGNIQIDAEVLAGLDNSDITANAIAGMGGNIDLSSAYIFGLESRNRLTSSSDITASSELGIDGTVTVNSPDTDLIEEILVAAEDVPGIPQQEIRAFPCGNSHNEKVRVLDAGFGIPPSPYDFSYDEGFVDLDGLGADQQANDIAAPAIVAWESGQPIVESNAIQTLPDGRVFLVNVQSQPHETIDSDICTRANRQQK